MHSFKYKLEVQSSLDSSISSIFISQNFKNEKNIVPVLTDLRDEHMSKYNVV